MKSNAYLSTLFACILLIGGTIAYLVANSLASLIASSLSALLFLIAAYALLHFRPWGNHLALSVSTLLSIFFAFRFFGQPAFVPGILTIMSAMVTSQLYLNRPKKLDDLS